jgi:Fur family ferric uptake transcriptional regulator
MEYLLKQHGLRVTEARLIVLETFLRSGRIFDHHTLLAACGGRVDRVTLYRTLHVFHLHELLYKVPSATGVMQYGLRRLGSGHHLHLVCGVCGKVIPIDSVAMPAMRLPPGFKAETVEMIVGGTCPECLGGDAAAAAPPPTAPAVSRASALPRAARPRPGQRRPHS